MSHPPRASVSTAPPPRRGEGPDAPRALAPAEFEWCRAQPRNVAVFLLVGACIRRAKQLVSRRDDDTPPPNERADAPLHAALARRSEDLARPTTPPPPGEGADADAAAAARNVVESAPALPPPPALLPAPTRSTWEELDLTAPHRGGPRRFPEIVPSRANSFDSIRSIPSGSTPPAEADGSKPRDEDEDRLGSSRAHVRRGSRFASSSASPSTSSARETTWGDLDLLRPYEGRSRRFLPSDPWRASVSGDGDFESRARRGALLEASDARPPGRRSVDGERILDAMHRRLSRDGGPLDLSPTSAPRTRGSATSSRDEASRASSSSSRRPAAADVSVSCRPCPPPARLSPRTPPPPPSEEDSERRQRVRSARAAKAEALEAVASHPLGHPEDGGPTRLDALGEDSANRAGAPPRVCRFCLVGEDEGGDEDGEGGSEDQDGDGRGARGVATTSGKRFPCSRGRGWFFFPRVARLARVFASKLLRPGTRLRDDLLVAPCACAGSQKWVHVGCLRRWTRVSVSDSGAVRNRCMVCKRRYSRAVRGVRGTLPDALSRWFRPTAADRLSGYERAWWQMLTNTIVAQEGTPTIATPSQLALVVVAVEVRIWGGREARGGNVVLRFLRDAARRCTNAHSVVLLAWLACVGAVSVGDALGRTDGPLDQIIHSGRRSRSEARAEGGARGGGGGGGRPGWHAAAAKAAKALGAPLGFALRRFAAPGAGAAMRLAEPAQSVITWVERYPQYRVM